MISPSSLRHQLSLQEELRAALSAFRNENVRNFLLNTDTRLDAKVVTSPLPQSRSVALRIKSLSKSVAATTFDDDFNFNVITNWLFLPAYDKDNYSLGIHLSKEDSKSTVSLLRPGFATTKYLRYIRDHAAGVHVSVGHYDDGIEVTFLRGLERSLRHRSGKVFRFNTAGFLRVMSDLIGDSPYFDIEKLMEHLNLVYSFEEDRHCPLCSAPPNVSCHCQRANSPELVADSCPLKRSLHNNRGEYAGYAFIELLAGGLSYRAVQSDRLTTVDLSEHNSLERNSLERQLISWAIRDRLSVLRPSLTKLVMPPTGVSNPLVRRKTAQEASSVSAALEDFFREPVVDVVMADASPPLLRPARRTRAPPPQIENQSRTPSGDEHRSPVASRSGALDGDGEAAAASPVLSLGSSGTAASGTRSEERKDELEASASSSADEIPEVIMRGLQVIREHGGSTKISREQLGKLVPMKQRDIAKVFRRARNREAAARSNEKRKQKLQALRRDLAEVRRREVEVREKHERLKVKNAQLRNAVWNAGAAINLPAPQGATKTAFA